MKKKLKSKLFHVIIHSSEGPLVLCLKNAIDLIQSLLVKKSEERRSAIQAVNHPWFNELYNKIRDKNIIRNLVNNLKYYKRFFFLQETSLSYLVHNYPQNNGVVDACKLFNKIDLMMMGKLRRNNLLIDLKMN